MINYVWGMKKKFVAAESCRLSIVSAMHQWLFCLAAP